MGEGLGQERGAVGEERIEGKGGEGSNPPFTPQLQINMQKNIMWDILII